MCHGGARQLTLRPDLAPPELKATGFGTPRLRKAGSTALELGDVESRAPELGVAGTTGGRGGAHSSLTGDRW
ncbi:hypothetical protein E2562_031959 [Oryza meyeriana var. granulata]|uniref:Uncharacterized protein n=1 Tax=Oryza meyeriana var. granulata TaxID=110450 RepID=A0A6G1ERS5_9ORYZ|nr:hypothetical protein E2562_031959 [Oryza meyeriana var. granulata]